MEPARPGKEFRVDTGGIYWILWSMLSSRAFLCAARVLWVLANNLYCIPAYFAYMALSAPLLLFSPAAFWRMEEVFFDWLLSMVACWAYTAGYRVVESGDDLDAVANSGASFLFLPNHQSTADVPLCMTLFVARRRFAERVMWVMDKIFKFTNFGWVAWMHDDFFILAGRENRERSLRELRTHLREVFVHKNRDYIVLFPEGGFLRKRKKVSQEFAKKQDLRHLENVTLPRTGALEIILEELAPSFNERRALESGAARLTNGQAAAGNGSAAAAAGEVKPREEDAVNAAAASSLAPGKKEISKVIDVTIAYPEARPLDLLAIATGYRRPCTTHVHYRVFDVKDIPTDPEKMRHWMYNLYYEKDEMLARFYQTGVFPHDFYDKEARKPKEVVHDPIRFLVLHLFFMGSSVALWKFSALAQAAVAAAILI